jgi:hypothetical protein
MDYSMSEDWIVSPLVGAGPLTFGITRSQARALLGDNFTVFRKGSTSTSETDAFDDLGVHLYYDDNQRLECIEIWGECSVFLSGISLLNVPVKDVLANLDAAQLPYHYDDGYFIDNCGCALYAPSDIVKAVTVCRRGYY